MPMQAIGNDGQWHEWEVLSQEERDAWMDAMTEADRIWDEWKRNGKPRTLKQQLLDYDQDHRIC